MSLSGNVYVLQYSNGSLQLTKESFEIIKNGNDICSNVIETFDVPVDLTSVYFNIFSFETGVNFTDILWAAFSNQIVLHSFFSLTAWLSNFFCKRAMVKKLFIKCWWNWVQVSISPTFYKLHFVRNCFAQLFSLYKLGFVIFLQNNFGTKLVKNIDIEDKSYIENLKLIDLEGNIFIF